MREDRLNELLSLWQEQRARGHDADAAVLCRECPELKEELSQRIAVLRRMSALGNAEPRDADATRASLTGNWQTGSAGELPEHTLGQVDDTESEPTPPTRRIPGYEILGVLGRGGMGIVYKARQLRPSRVVALKMILSGQHAGGQTSARFLREAEAIARLQHPNVVQIYELGNHEGKPYLSLEYLAGGSLAARVNGHPQPPHEAARIVETLARAVQAAHAEGIIHRDLKPANVLLTPDGTPKITDFGLAKRQDEAGDTRTGAVLGTPSYMAPEQAQGNSAGIGPAADVYALGATLYDLLTGRPPYKGMSAVDTVLQILHTDPVAPSRLQPKVPPDLETVCLKCLQKDPRRRYASAADLAEDLRRFQAGEPILARPVARLERAWRWARRNRAVAASLLLVTLSLVTTAVVSTCFWLWAERARQAEAARAVTEAEAKREAERARRAAQRQLIEVSETSALNAARGGDHSLAVLWFAQAAHQAQDEPALQERNRLQAAKWLRGVCLPQDTFALAAFRQRKDRFRTFQFSPDGRYLLVTASTGDCLVWDCRQSRQVSLPGPCAKSLVGAWEPNRGLLAVAGKEGRIRLLSPPSFQPVEEVTADGEVSVLGFSKDGERLAWGGTAGARVWDRGRKEYLTPLLVHPDPVATLSFSTSGGLLATSAGDKARVFRIGSPDSEPLFPAVPHARAEHGLAHGGADRRVAPRFAADDQVLLTVERTAEHAHRLAWRSATSGALMKTSPAPPGQEFLTTFAVSPQGNAVAVLWESNGQLWDARKQEAVASLSTGRLNWCEDVTFAADGKTVLTCGHNMLVQAWSTDDASEHGLGAAFPPVLHPMSVVRASLSPSGRHMAAALWDGTVYLWRVPAGLRPAYTRAAGGTTLPALSPDRRLVLPAGTTYWRNATQRNTRVYEAETGKAVGPVLEPGGILLNAVFSPDGAWVATASSGGQTMLERQQRQFEPEGKGGNVQVWDWRTGKRLVGPVPTPGEPHGLAFRPNGRALAVVCADYRVILMDPRTGTITHRLDPGIRTRPFLPNLWWGNGEARFSPDGRFLVTWEMAAPVHVWDPDTGRLLHTLPHDERVEGVAFSPVAPGLLATVGRDCVARVWDLPSGKILAELQHPGNLSRVRFSPDGTELLTGCGDGMLRIWDWKAGKLRYGLALHTSMVMDFDLTSDGRWLVTLGRENLQLTDWRTKTPAGPLWRLGPSIHLALNITAGDSRVVVGGFSRSLEAYDLKAMTTPATRGASEDLVRLPELVAGRRILDQVTVVPLSSSEWASRWRLHQRERGPGSVRVGALGR